MSKVSIFKKIALLVAFANITLILHAQTDRPLLHGIHAEAVSTNRIEVSWQLPEPSASYTVSGIVLYRDTKPISSVASLKPLVSLPPNTMSYRDRLKDYKEYYYAAIAQVDYSKGSLESDSKDKEDLYYDEELDKPESGLAKHPYTLILPGVNATVNGVKVNGKKAQKKIPVQKDEAQDKVYQGDEMRSQPLPYVDILGDKRSAHKREIGDEAEEKALKLAKTNSTREIQILEPHIFEEDMVSPTGGDGYLLFEVLKTTFIKKKYEEAAVALQKFLAQNRSKSVTERANFYLGESFYYSGQFPKALNCFLPLQETYPSLTKKWIESTLDLYQIPVK